MNTIIKSIRDRIISIWKISDEVARGKAVETIEYELEEMENIFGILVFGFLYWYAGASHANFAGFDASYGKRTDLMMEKVDTANEPIARTFFGLRHRLAMNRATNVFSWAKAGLENRLHLRFFRCFWHKKDLRS